MSMRWANSKYTRNVYLALAFSQISSIHKGALKFITSLSSVASSSSMIILKSEIEKEGQQSKISLPFWAVLTSLPVFLSSLWASPLLFSAKDQFEKERHEVLGYCNVREILYSPVPLFLCLMFTCLTQLLRNCYLIQWCEMLSSALQCHTTPKLLK